MSTPSFAERPMPATMETGIEITRAPGHAITSKVSASSTLWVMRPTANAAIMTPGVYHLEKRSKNVCVFALSSCASSTRWMIFAKVESDPTAVASTRSTPLRNQVPAKTSAPSDFSAGTDSRSEEHTSELQSRGHLVCRLLLEKKNMYTEPYT